MASATFTEAPVQAKMVELLTGRLEEQTGLSYEFISREEMNQLRVGRMGDAIVEPLAVEGLRAINDDLSEAEAAEVVAHLRRITSAEDFLACLRDGITIAFAPGEPERTMRLLDLAAPERNRRVVTTEFELRTGAIREPRLDVVCFINGLPLGLVETKAPKEPWKKAARDFEGYWRDAPQLEVLGAVAIATNGSKLRVAPTGAPGASAYKEWKTTWPFPEPEADRELEFGCLGVLHPATLPDLAANFVVFETRAGKTTKKLARYQQYRATNKLVERVLGGEHDRGIIWHAPGAGKSLTMVFAARKLMRSGLERPTVLLIIDRRDLDNQINETLTACSFPGVEQATSRNRLHELLKADKRGVIVTTVQKFSEELSGLQQRENVIAFVDEAHRTQIGSFGIWMRDALPNAKLFAFTGTPIERGDQSTRKGFSPVIDGEYENYLDAYSWQQSVKDKATVEIRYEPRLAEWSVDGDKLNARFEEEFGELTDEEKDALREDAARLKVVAKTPDRIEPIAAEVAEYLTKKTAPQGFKAQLVAVDREACALYAEELGTHLSPEEFAVVYTTGKDDGDLLRRWYAREQLARLGRPSEGTAEEVDQDEEALVEASEAVAMRTLIDDFKRPDHPLKLLIVCDMLLTGFDVDIEQVMFLDKPLRSHRLLQAISRTNRTAPGKDRGVVVDYWGVFKRLEAALAEFSPEEVKLAALDLDELRERFPVALAEALALVAGLPADKDEYEQMIWLLKYFSDHPEKATQFEDRFQIAQSIYETLTPDRSLAPHLDGFKRLLHLRALWRHGSRQDQEDSFDVAEYRAHTHKLVQDAVSLDRLRTDLPVYRVDEKYLTRIDGKGLSPDEKAAEIEAALVHEVKVRGEHDPLATSLAERLEELRQRKQESDQEMLEMLEEYEELARKFAEEQGAHQKLGLTPRAYGVLILARKELDGADEQQLVGLASQVEEKAAELGTFSGWTEREDVLRELRKQLMLLLAKEPSLRKLLNGPFIDDAIAALISASEEPPTNE